MSLEVDTIRKVNHHYTVDIWTGDKRDKTAPVVKAIHSIGSPHWSSRESEEQGALINTMRGGKVWRMRDE